MWVCEYVCAQAVTVTLARTSLTVMALTYQTGKSDFNLSSIYMIELPSYKMAEHIQNNVI